MLILKVLNGPLFGAEITLPTNDCLIRVIDTHQDAVDADVEYTLDQWAKDTVLTIPLAGHAFNIILRRNGGDSDVHFFAEIYTAHIGMTVQEIALNTPISLGALRVAMRHTADTWSKAVLCDGRPERFATSSSPAAARNPATRRPRPLLALASATVIACAALLIWFSLPNTAPAATVARQLAGLSGDIIHGSDRSIYVIARDATTAGIIKRVLARAALPDVQVRTRNSETERINHWLDSNGLRHFAADIQDPSRPVLVLRGPVPASFSAADIKAHFLALVPYAKDVELRWRSDGDARHAAQNLVAAVGAHATFHQTAAHFIVTVSDYLSDTQLDALGRALASYRQQWGGQYTEFMINQQDPSHIAGLKTGRFGYEFRQPGHIYFPDASL